MVSSRVLIVLVVAFAGVGWGARLRGEGGSEDDITALEAPVSDDNPEKSDIQSEVVPNPSRCGGGPNIALAANCDAFRRSSALDASLAHTAGLEDNEDHPRLKNKHDPHAGKSHATH